MYLRLPSRVQIPIKTTKAIKNLHETRKVKYVALAESALPKTSPFPANVNGRK